MSDREGEVSQRRPRHHDLAARLAVELKLCELGCGRMFVRPVPLNARVGQKACKACLALRPEQREVQYAAQLLREMNARRGVMA
jgi:hypothetical protein